MDESLGCSVYHYGQCKISLPRIGARGERALIKEGSAVRSTWVVPLLNS